MKVTTKMMDGKNSCNYDRLESKHFEAYNNCVTIGKSYKQIYLSPLNGYDDFVVGPAILIKKNALKQWAS